MLENRTIARPYARALFDLAVKTKKINVWSDVLFCLQKVLQDQIIIKFLKNPFISSEEKAYCLIDSFGLDKQNDSNYLNNFIFILSSSNRLLFLKEIYQVYEELREIQEKEVSICVVFAEKNNDFLVENIKSKIILKQSNNILLKTEQDGSLLAGALFKIGDRVIDGSIRGKLQKLHAQLVQG